MIADRSRARTAVAGGLLAASVIGSCGGVPFPLAKAPVSSAPRTVEVYFPLTDQSQWTYRIQDFGRRWTYLNTVRVHGNRYVAELKRSGIAVEERYSGNTALFVVEEQEPMLYFRENGFLSRIFLTYQGGNLVPTSGSGESQFLPEDLSDGKVWASDTQAFRVGGDLGFRVNHRHTISTEREVVHVPAGDFENCVRIDTFSTQGPNSGRNGEELVFYYVDWYAPGVGLIRSQQWDDEERSHERARIELLKYKVESRAGVSAGGAN